MRGQRVEIKGINRQIGSPDNDTGFCSELVNLSPQLGLKVAGQKEVVSANIPYTRIRMHRINTTTNYIGIKDDATGVGIYHFNPESGNYIQEIDLFPAGTDIEYTLLNNQLVISDRTNIKEYVWEFKNGQYIKSFDGLNFDVSSHFTPAFTNSRHVKDLYATSKEAYISAMQAYVNQFKVENKEYAEGAFLYAFTITLKDGVETGMYNLTAVNTQWTESPSNRGSFIELEAYIVKPYAEGKPIKTTFKFDNFFQKTTLNISPNANALEKYKDQISKVNLYVSRPVSKFRFDSDIEFQQDGAWSADSAVKFNTVFDPIMINTSGVEKELLYMQKSWSLEEFCSGLEYTLEFGGDIQTTGATMEVSASSIERAGKMYAYNNKVHFYDSKVRINSKLGELCSLNEENTANFTVYVYLNTGNKDNILKFENIKVKTISDSVFPNKRVISLPDMVVFPDSRAYKMAFTTDDASVIGFTSTALVYSMTPSPAYNYSYFFSDSKTSTVSDYEVLNAVLSDTYEETNAINVSANGNPMVFPVSYSYRIDGNITSITTATESISQSQVGQYPLQVFTDNGVYALEQGNGAVLYSNIVPINGDIINNRSVIYTRNGIAYIANGAVYLLNGRHSTKLTELLEGDLDTYIQNNESFIKCCANSLYNVTDYLSQVTFREFAENATLSWCANTNELIVSNTNYKYSYVYNFTYNSWYKVGGTYEAIEDNFVLTPVTINDKGAVPATGKIKLAAIHAEKERIVNTFCVAPFNTAESCSAGHTVALVIDNTQVASATFSQTTFMPMIMSVLCEDVSYLEDYDGKLYSLMDLNGKTVMVYNVTTGTDLSLSMFEASSEGVTIPDKAINATISVTVNGKTYTDVFTDSDSVITTLSTIASKINASDTNVYASHHRDTITLTAKNAGLSGNNISISASTSDPDYIYIKASTMTGGSDINLQPSSYRQILDWSKDDMSKETTVHLHTRPLFLGDKNTYKTVRSALLNCMTNLIGTQNLSMYIYASDNLIDWKCVCAAQRQNCNISQLTTNRSAKAYKYFVFMIGGLVNHKTQLSDIILTIEDVTNKKPR